MQLLYLDGEIVNEGEVEVQFSRQNLTAVGGIGLFYRFARELSYDLVQIDGRHPKV